jgi:hypothetical protein
MKLLKQKMLVLLAIAGFAMTFASCDSIASLIKVNVPMTTPGLVFAIPIASAGTDNADFTYAINVDSLIKSYNSSLGVGNIQSVEVDSFKLTLSGSGATGPDGSNNFQNIDSASATFASNGNTSPLVIATIASNPDTYATSLTIPVNSTIDLKSYFNATIFYFSLHSRLRTALTKSLECTASAYFKIKTSL